MSDIAEMFSDFGEYLRETYSPNLENVQNFDTTDVQRFLPLLIIGVCVGLFLAIVASYYNGEFLGRTVRGLYKLGAFSPETAKTLDEISCNRRLIRRTLLRDSVLAKYVKPTSEIKTQEDAKKASFYIPEADKYIADKRFKPVRGGFLTIIISFIICTVLCFVLLYWISDIIQLADNAITLIKSN